MTTYEEYLGILSESYQFEAEIKANPYLDDEGVERYGYIRYTGRKQPDDMWIVYYSDYDGQDGADESDFSFPDDVACLLVDLEKKGYEINIEGW